MNQRGIYPAKFSSSRATAAFSLVELLVVVALILVLFTLYWGSGSRHFQTEQLGHCGNHLQNIYVALKTYSIDNGGHLPALASASSSEPVLSQLIPRCTTATEDFICPGSSDSALPAAQPFADRRISYAYYMGQTVQGGADQPLLSDRQVNANDKHIGEPIFSNDGKKPGNNHNRFGGNILFCDGDVRVSPAASAFNLSGGAGVVLLNPKP